MLLDHVLDLLPRIAAGIDQILVGLVELVFVQLHLRLGKVELVLELVFLVGFGLRHCGGEIIDALLIRGKQCLGLLDADLYGGGRGIQCRRMSFGIAQRFREGEVEFVVGDA